MTYLKFVVIPAVLLFGFYYVLKKFIIPALFPDKVDKSVKEEFDETQQQYQQNVDNIKKKAEHKQEEARKTLEETEEVNNRIKHNL